MNTSDFEKDIKNNYKIISEDFINNNLTKYTLLNRYLNKQDLKKLINFNVKASLKGLYLVIPYSIIPFFIYFMLLFDYQLSLANLRSFIFDYDFAPIWISLLIGLAIQFNSKPIRNKIVDEFMKVIIDPLKEELSSQFPDLELNTENYILMYLTIYGNPETLEKDTR